MSILQVVSRLVEAIIWLITAIGSTINLLRLSMLNLEDPAIVVGSSAAYLIAPPILLLFLALAIRGIRQAIEEIDGVKTKREGFGSP